MNQIYRFWKTEDGLTAVEYAIVAALMLVSCIMAINTFCDTTDTVFSKAAERFETGAKSTTNDGDSDSGNSASPGDDQGGKGDTGGNYGDGNSGNNGNDNGNTGKNNGKNSAKRSSRWGLGW